MEPAKYGGFFKRLLALLIDKAVLIAVFPFIITPFAFLISLLGFQDVIDGQSKKESFTMLTAYVQDNFYDDEGLAALFFFLAFNFIMIIITWLYNAIMESSKHQATIGKMAVGLKITNEYGEKISFIRATGRYLGCQISSLMVGIGYIIQPFTEKKQALHDLMANTVVINKSYEIFMELAERNQIQKEKEEQFLAEEASDENMPEPEAEPKPEEDNDGERQNDVY